MENAHIVVTVVAVLANGFSGAAAVAHLAPILPGMDRAGVPRSWLTFPIGTLKLLGALGLLAGLLGPPLVGLAAAVGLSCFFVCAVHTHLLAGDHSPQLGYAVGFLVLNVTTLALGLAV